MKSHKFYTKTKNIKILMFIKVIFNGKTREITVLTKKLLWMYYKWAPQNLAKAFINLGYLIKKLIIPKMIALEILLNKIK